MLSEGTRFAGRFTVLRELGDGGMGAVYAVRDERLNRQGALKVLHARLLKKDPGARERFVREARATGNVNSDYVVKVLDFAENPDGVPWMLMELLEGETLEARVAKHGPLSLPTARRLVLQLGHALGAAHAEGVVHMDLKPANIFLARTARLGEEEVLKVLDFGLARVIPPDRTSADNSRGMGSYAWSAPEQFGEAKVHKSVDVWPLGLLAFWMLTGRQYWLVQNTDDVVNRDVALFKEANIAPLVPATERASALGVADRLPPGFDAWFARCAVRDPAERFADGDTATRALEAILDAAQRASEASARPSREATRVAEPSVPRGFTEPALPEVPEVMRAEAAAGQSVDATVAVPGMAEREGSARAATVVVPDLSRRTTAPQEVSSEMPPRDGRTVWIAGGVLVAAVVAAGVASGFWRAPRDADAGSSRAPSARVQPTAPPVAPAADVPRAAPPAAPPVAPSCPAAMRLVPAGTFSIGSADATSNSTDSPAHPAMLRAFCIDEHEVTRADYVACSQRGDARACAEANEAWWESADRDEVQRHVALCTADADVRRPAACVSWGMAQLYCEQRGGSLPTEAQWEYAARGTDRRVFPWGNDPPTLGQMNGCGAECFAFWFPRQQPREGDVLYLGDDGAATAVDVSRFTQDRSAFGVYGMGGNVSEWTRDCVGAYPTGAHPEGGAPCVGSPPHRVARGGSWNSASASAVRVTSRTDLHPATQQATLGFRCVITPR